MKNIQIQINEAAGAPSLEDQLKEQAARGIRSGVITRTAAKNVTVTEGTGGTLVASPGERMTVETGITEVQRSLDSLGRQIKEFNRQITALENREVPTNHLGTPTVDPTNFAGNKASAILRLERLRQPLLDAQQVEYAQAVARGDTNLYAVDNPQISNEAIAELVVRGEAQEQSGIKTEVRSIPGGPTTVEVMRMDDGDIALEYLAKS